MRVAELEGAALDYWVAKAEGQRAKISHGHCYSDASPTTFDGIGYYQPSKSWNQGGQIIERGLISLIYCPVDAPGEAGTWHASFGDYDFKHASPLVAAMRAYVASKYGYRVPTDPDKPA